MVKLFWGLDGRYIGRFHTNPFFDTHEYVIEFTDGAQDNYAINIIAKNIHGRWMMRVISFSYLWRYRTNGRIGRRYKRRK